MEGPEPHLCLPDVRTNAKISFHQNKRAYASERDASPAHKTHLKLTKTLKVCRAKQEPAMISNHLVVCQEKTTNVFLVRPLVVKISLSFMS